MRKVIFFVLITVFLLSGISINAKYISPVSSEGDFNSGNFAYSIYIPGEKTADGNLPAKIYNIPYVKEGEYLPNAIHVKTKSRVSFNKNTNAVYSSTLMVDLNDLDVEKVTAPFSKSGGDNPLENEPYGIDRILEIYYGNGENPYDVCRRLMDNPEVEYAVPIFVYHTFYTPNDPKTNKQWWLKNIKLNEAWDVTKGSKDVVIGIVDSGIDWHHSDLADNIWINPNEIPDNNIDDDHNGKIDDVRGWDLVGNINQNEIGQGRWKEDNDPYNPGSTSNNKHGTHVSGCASAVTDNNNGIAGTGFNTKLVMVKCATDQNIRGIYRGYEGITYMANLGVDIINCSWGGPGYTPVGQDIINNAVAKGALVVVAAGNDGINIDNGEFYPAGYDNVLVVGATRSNNRKASFSCWGLITTVYTPGQSIYSTMPGNTYASQNGTSMASPITAGVAALVKALHPDWTPKQILHQLRSTSDNVVATSPDLRPYYYGRLNAEKAVKYNRSGGTSVPGIEISKITIGSNDALTNYDPVLIVLDVTNYLAPAGNVVLKFEAQNNFIGVNTNEISVGNLNQMQTKTVSLAVQLLKTNPWYEGNGAIIVTIEANNYVDYQLIKIPVKINSDNRYVYLGGLPEVYVPHWMGASSPSRDIVWAVGIGGMFGSRGGFFKIDGSTTVANIISSQYAYCVSAIDANRAWVGSSNRTNTAAAVNKTSNAGASWSAVDVSSITTFVNTVHFYDKNKGVFIGDPKNSKWGIGLTSNGGNNWNQPQVMPPPLADESGLAGCGSYVGDIIWFGTNKGRIIRSTDKGKTWNASTINGVGQIWAVAILDDKNGLAVYSPTGSDNKYIASTTNGGVSWQKDRYDFQANKLNPIYFYTNPLAGRIYMLCSGGQVYSTNANGAKWDPVLTKYHGNVMIGAATDVPVSKMRMWDLGQSYGHLDFNYLPKDIIKTIKLISDDKIVFDTATVGKFKIGAASVENTGNVPIKINPKIIPDAGVSADEFLIYSLGDGVIEPTKTKAIRVKFMPKEEGLRTAVLSIKSNAEPDEIQVQLIGPAKESPTSVLEINELPAEIVVSPNPASNFVAISNNKYKFDNVYIIDMNGKQLKEYKNVNINKFDVSDLRPGVYFIVFRTDKKVFYSKISIVR